MLIFYWSLQLRAFYYDGGSCKNWFMYLCFSVFKTTTGALNITSEVNTDIYDWSHGVLCISLAWWAFMHHHYQIVAREWLKQTTSHLRSHRYSFNINHTTPFGKKTWYARFQSYDILSVLLLHFLNQKSIMNY